MLVAKQHAGRNPRRFVGLSVGLTLGLAEGITEGDIVGFSVGLIVGLFVGEAVSVQGTTAKMGRKSQIQGQSKSVIQGMFIGICGIAGTTHS